MPLRAVAWLHVAAGGPLPSGFNNYIIFHPFNSQASSLYFLQSLAREDWYSKQLSIHDTFDAERIPTHVLINFIVSPWISRSSFDQTATSLSTRTLKSPSQFAEFDASHNAD